MSEGQRDDFQPGAAESAAATTPPSVEPPLLAGSPSFRYQAQHTDPFEEEFRNVQHAGGFYAAMVLPVLIGTGWSFHTKSNAVEIDFWTSAGLYGVIAVYAVIWRRDWWALLRLPAGGSKRWVFAVCLTPVATIAAAMFLQYAAIKVGLPVQDLTGGYGEGGYSLWLLAVLLIGLAPVFEEIAFRGLLMSRLQRVMAPAQAIWVTATLFGVLHFSVLGMLVFLVPLAAVAGYLTRETKSLLPAIAIHAAHNAGVLFLDLW